MVGDIIQPTHLLFILVVALLVLGPKRLPEVGRQLGNGIRDFRAAISGEHNERHPVVEESFDMSHPGSSPDSPVTPTDHSFAPQPIASGTAAPAADIPLGAGSDRTDASGTEASAVGTGTSIAGPNVPVDHEFAHEAPASDAAPSDRPS
jgi:sec-independent protein translocase protein TatA